ncbi:polysaccharide deacetylase family protein [Pelomonas aquatica]|jgi:peptidoglycan/xylan/chitin deacetylase (PgdA/CDA1 family)|uniref:Polysaccharide deacetylase family protein n=1 Tax=Pelomonas aquatica TaxID=431058 RepID=A0A9X4LP34_9BURK|nr:polysaccharide deacetylase family protein [Pelomonas aquatica]MCY4756637.1 polysaccharide deacetylase family protein [Pelomonas aquatica]MDG0863828.1 polysaccharide deacetylase family protein [Pelomonas aquatica]
MKTLFSLLSPAGARARLTVLIFHRVLREPDPLFPDEVDAARFDELLAWVKSWFNVLPLDTAIRQLHEGCLPARAAALSFDDGYADNHDIALPLLLKHGLSCSFFIATGFLDGGRMWNDTLIESVRLSSLSMLDLRGLADGRGEDLGQHALGDDDCRRAALGRLVERVKYLPPAPRQACVDAIAMRAEVKPPDDLMMSSEQVRGLQRAGMQIGAHTVSHPILAKLDALKAADEIVGSRNQLQALLRERVGLFAYPNGKPGTDYLPDVHPALVREFGFDAAVSTRWATARRGDDVFQIPRFTPWDRDRLKFGLRLARNLIS